MIPDPSGATRAPQPLTELLAEVKAALQQATPGPWMRGSRHGTYCTEITSADGGREIAAVWNYADAFAPGELRPVQQLSAQGEADFALMQHAPEWLGALVQAVEHQQRRIVELEHGLEKRVSQLERGADFFVGPTEPSHCIFGEVFCSTSHPCARCLAADAAAAKLGETVARMRERGELPPPLEIK